MRAEANEAPKNWLLLRGLARGQGHWGSFKDAMEARFPNDHFEYLDLPGNGERFAEKSPLRIKDYVADLRRHSQYLKSKEPFRVLALSLAGMVTVEWMKSYPHEIEKAFLVCTSSAKYAKFYQRFQLGNFKKIGAALPFANNPTVVEDAILSMITNNPARRSFERAELTEYSQAHPVQWANVVRQMAAASQYRFPKKAPGEITLIGSYGDRLVAPECTINIARLWNLEPVMHPNSGHDIAIDDPRWLLEQLL